MMNRILKILFLTFTLPCYILSGAMVGQPRPAHPQSQVSVHDMFKDLSEDEIVQLMEEGQREMERIMTQATPEEQEAFMRMMEETLKNFSDEDFAEIEKIVQVVEPRLSEKMQEEVVKPEPVKTEKKPETKSVVISGDSSLAGVLESINKIVNGILLKAKSDHNLHDVLTQWNKKNDFNEMIRLLHALNKKELIIKLTTTKSDDVKKFVDTIENFNKRLILENKQFTVADTFGLEIDAKTSAENVVKLNIILDFFGNATETLLPMIVKFFQEYEPEALKLAKAHDDQAKQSLDAAKQIEKMKRPNGGYTPSDNIPSNGSYKQQGRNDYDQYGYGNQYGGQHGQSNRDYGSSPQDRRARNKMNADGGGSTTPSMPSEKSGTPKATEKQVEKMDAEKQKTKEAADKKEKDEKADLYKNALRNLERYDDLFDQASFDEYVKTLHKTDRIFEEFDKAVKAAPAARSMPNELKKGFTGPLTLEDAKLKEILENDSNYLQNEPIKHLYKKNTLAARDYHASLKGLIDNIKPNVDALKTAVTTTRNELGKLSLQDLNNLKSSQALKNIKSRFESYQKNFYEIQVKLKNKHQMYKIKSETFKLLNMPESNSDYDKLENEIMSLHGLDKTIDETRLAIDSLERNINAEIKQRQREKK